MQRRSAPVRGRAQRGAAAVELAIVLPVLLMIVFGIIDFGRMYNAQVTLTEAAREGVRAAAFGQSVTVADSRARQVTGPGMTVTTQVRYLRSNGTTANACASGIDAEVTVNHTFTFITPFNAIAGMFGESSGSAWPMTGRGVMTCTG